MILMKILKLESPSFYYTVIKESANVSVRFMFQNTTNILSKYVHKQMVTLSFLLKHHQFNSNCWELHIPKQINSSWESWSKSQPHLLCLSFSIVSFSCLWWLLLTSRTCNIFGSPGAFLGGRRSFQCCSYCPVHLQVERNEKITLSRWL